MLRVLSRVSLLGIFLAAACGDPAPRMHVVRARVHVGERVVVHLEESPRRHGELWLTLVPPSAPASFVGERIVVDDGATQVTVPTAAPGTFEVRLHDAFPERSHHVVARAAIEVEPAAVARRDPPVWYW
jgi:hypothetical protein